MLVVWSPDDSLPLLCGATSCSIYSGLVKLVLEDQSKWQPARNLRENLLHVSAIHVESVSKSEDRYWRQSNLGICSKKAWPDWFFYIGQSRWTCPYFCLVFKLCRKPQQVEYSAPSPASGHTFKNWSDGNLWFCFLPRIEQINVVFVLTQYLKISQTCHVARFQNCTSAPANWLQECADYAHFLDENFLLFCCSVPPLPSPTPCRLYLVDHLGESQHLRRLKCHRTGPELLCSVPMPHVPPWSICSLRAPLISED